MDGSKDDCKVLSLPGQGERMPLTIAGMWEGDPHPEQSGMETMSVSDI